MPAKKSTLILLCSFAIISTLALFVPITSAQAPAITYIPVALAPVQRDSPVELVALTLDAQIKEINGHSIITATSTFKLHNTDRLTDLQVPMGFPTWAGDPFGFDPNRLDGFSVTVDGKKIALQPARSELKIGNMVRTVDWYTFTLPILGDEKRIVQMDFQQDLGDNSMPTIHYGLVTANGWKNNVGSARLTIAFPSATTLEQIIATDPPNSSFDGNSVTWLFQNNEPLTNPYLALIKPSIWSNLLARRRAARQNPNDSDAHTALGSLYLSLSQYDTPKRDSLSAQGIAELESSIRADPNNYSARQLLAALYEARAGPAIGPRNSAYVQLAVENWQVLATNDGNARRQLAEDYFSLGIDAQTRGAYADAQNYFDRAALTFPGGAGPLFTLDRESTQKHTLNLSWMRSALNQEDTALAMSRARVQFGDGFVDSFQVPTFFVTHSSVTTGEDRRKLEFTLARFGAPSNEWQNQLNRIVTSAQAVGIESSLDDRNSTVIFTIPFEDVAQLESRQTALADALGDLTEWALVRSILSPMEFDWSVSKQNFEESTRYQEYVDLGSACSRLNAQVQSISQSLAALGNAADEDSSVKRALLQNAQRGWQSGVDQANVTYRVGLREFPIEPCATRDIQSTDVTLMPLGYAAISVALMSLAGGIWFWKRRSLIRTKKLDTQDP